MPKNLIQNIYKDYSGQQKKVVYLKFLSKLSASKVLVSKNTGTVFHDDIIKNKDNKLYPCLLHDVLLPPHIQ